MNGSIRRDNDDLPTVYTTSPVFSSLLSSIGSTASFAIVVDEDTYGVKIAVVGQEGSTVYWLANLTLTEMHVPSDL